MAVNIGNCFLANTVERKISFKLLNDKRPNVDNLTLYDSFHMKSLAINLVEKIIQRVVVGYHDIGVEYWLMIM